MKILFTTPVLLHPPAGGPELRIENAIIALSRVADVHIISRASKQQAGGQEGVDFYKTYSTNFSYSPSTDPKEIWPSSFLLRAINKISYVLFKRLPIKYDEISKDADFILDYIDKNEINIIWFGYGNISYPLMKLIHEKRPKAKLVCDTDSVWSRYVLRELPYIEDKKRKKKVKREGKQKEIEEMDWVKFCNVTTGVSGVDVEYYQSIAEDSNKVKMFSNVVNVQNYQTPVSPPAGHQRPCVYLAGTFWENSPMEKASLWIINEVLPIVKETIPEIHFYIIGRGSDRILKDVKDDSITITGMLDSVLPYLCNADVSIVPLTFESGTRFKILEAAACGIPIVSTTLGAEGIPITHGENILIADEKEDFATAIIKLIQDKEYAKKLADDCLGLINSNYGIDVLVKEGKDILDGLNQPS